MSGDDLGPVTVGAREIYDKLVDVGEVVIRLDSKLDGHATKLADHEELIDDHETRLREIERSRWPMSPATVISGALALAALLLEMLPKLAVK